MEVDDIRFLIAPTDAILEVFTGAKSIYKSNIGYYFSQLNIVIDKSCSGFNFLLICFLMVSFVLLKSGIVRNWLVIPLSVLIAYATTIIANVSRIVGYLTIMDNNINIAIDPKDEWLHQAEGIFVYLFFLILLYFMINQVIKKLHINEETT